MEHAQQRGRKWSNENRFIPHSLAVHYSTSYSVLKNPTPSPLSPVHLLHLLATPSPLTPPHLPPSSFTSSLPPPLDPYLYSILLLFLLLLSPPPLGLSLLPLLSPQPVSLPISLSPPYLSLSSRSLLILFSSLTFHASYSSS